jgi:hypothetical protein
MKYPITTDADLPMHQWKDETIRLNPFKGGIFLLGM